MEPKTSVGKPSFQDNAVEATSTPDDLPPGPAEGRGGAASAPPPVKPSDASENAQGNEIRDEDMEPSDEGTPSADNPAGPAGTRR